MYACDHGTWSISSCAVEGKLDGRLGNGRGWRGGILTVQWISVLTKYLPSFKKYADAWAAPQTYWCKFSRGGLSCLHSQSSAGYCDAQPVLNCSLVSTYWGVSRPGFKSHFCLVTLGPGLFIIFITIKEFNCPIFLYF